MKTSLIKTFLICSIAVLQIKSEYIIDLLEMEWNVTSTNSCEMFWEVTRPSRGVFAFSGYFNVKEDINTDKSTSAVYIYYSKNGISYMLTPFQIPPTVSTNYVNIAYTNYMKETVKKCCKNAIDYEGKFVSPLTKREMICKDCLLEGNNYPTHLRPGYYRILNNNEGELGFAVMLLFKVEIE